MKISKYIEISDDFNINTYKFTYDSGEVFCFLKQIEQTEYEQVEFSEKVLVLDCCNQLSDYYQFEEIDEFIETKKSIWPNKNGLYEIKGKGIKYSPFIKAIKNNKLDIQFRLIKPIEDTIVNLNKFFFNDNTTSEERKKELINYYFGLFDIEHINSINRRELINNIEPSKELDNYIEQSDILGASVLELETVGVKVLKK